MLIYRCFMNGARALAQCDRVTEEIHFSNGFHFFLVVSWSDDFSLVRRLTHHLSLHVISVTTTTPAPPQTPPTECLRCQCGKSNKNKIVGGTETGVNQYPWMAMLLYSNRFYCGASLINDRYVLGKINELLTVQQRAFIQQIKDFIS